MTMSAQETLELCIASAATDIHALLIQYAAKAGNVSYEAFSQAVIRALANVTGDGRTVDWSARLRIYAAPFDNSAEPQADTDAAALASEPGATIFAGLPAIGEWIVALASQHHNAPCVGLDAVQIARKIKGLRTQLSQRGDGTGVLRVRYTVSHGGIDALYMARCDVARLDKLPPARRMPGETDFRN